MATARSSLAFPGRTAHHGAMSEPTTPTIDPVPEGLAERAALLGGTEGILTDEQIREFVAGQLASTEVDGKSVCLIIPDGTDRKSTRLNSSHVAISYAVFCLKKKRRRLIAAAGYTT